MTHVVTFIRHAVRAELVSEVADVTWDRSHWKMIDVSKLPRGAVMTPRVVTQRINKFYVARSVNVEVLVKRDAGPDIEDEFDAQSAVIEQAVLRVLDRHSETYGLSETTIKIDDGARGAVGELHMVFATDLVTEEGEPEHLVC